MPLPFTGADVPNVLLDILRGCNVRCRACYNGEAIHTKPVSEVLAEFEFARSRRRLDCVTLLGGEPLLHPDLLEIVRALKARGVRVAIFTNALGLDAQRAADLKAAGVDLVVMHLEEQQERADLRDGTPAALRNLQETKLAILAQAGLEGGLSITAMQGQEWEIHNTLETALASPHLSFLLVTLHLDAAALPPLAGDIFTGIRALEPMTADPSDRPGRLAKVLGVLNGRMGQPFAVHPSIDGDPRWHAHLVATVTVPGREPFVRPLRPTWMEALLNRVLRWVRGRYFFYQPQRRRLQFVHLLLNGLAGGGLGRNLGVIVRALRPGASLRIKRCLLQVPANLDASGRLVFCRDCPDAVVRHGALVPVCIVDRMADPQQAASAGEDLRP
jgi:hypothetical protein